MSDDSHQHTMPDGDVVHSNEDGSCNVCADDAQARGSCRHCYGQGSFTAEDALFDCSQCCGTGRQMTSSERARYRNEGYKPRSLSFAEE